MIKLIATDMDGTWLNDHQGYDHDLFKKEFAIMKERDIKFVIASGNQFENLRTRFPEEGDQLYYVAENGCLVAQGRQVLHVDALDEDEVKQLFQIASSYNYPVVVAGLASAYVLKKFGQDFYHEMKKYFEKLRTVNSFDEIDDQIFKVSLTIPEDKLPTILEHVRNSYPNFNFVAGAADSLDMQKKGMNKAVGLKYLGKKLGISAKEMVTFGDSGNDVGMLQYAGKSFVTQFALPEAKKAADQIIGSSNNSAVQKEILKLLQ